MTSLSIPIVWHSAYEVDIGPHVFPTQKYRMVCERLMEEQAVRAADIVTPTPATDEQIQLVHTREYLRKLATSSLSQYEQMVLEVPYSIGLKEAMWLCTGGTVLAAHHALVRGLAVHLGGGFHHAYPDHGEGFCLVNDVAVAARVLQQNRACERVAVFDCDVHQGNGTAAIFASDATVFTFSIHQDANYPAYKPPSDMDLGLPNGVGDEEYIGLLEQHVPAILEKHRPDLVFYLAGADPYEHDQLGGLDLTIGGLRRRDEHMMRMLRQSGAPVVVTLAGGYAVNPDDTVAIHCGTVHAAQQVSAEDGVQK